MLIPRSRINQLATPHRFNVIRLMDHAAKSMGNIVASQTELLLYEKVPARWTELREFTENVLMPKGFGNTSADIFRVYGAFKELPTKLLRGDILKVPYGSKPNYYNPPNRPFGPDLWILTPGGNVLLNGNNEDSSYSGGGYTLSETDDEWCLTAEDFEHCFTTQNPLCETFPEGYRFLRVTGPYKRYEILRFETMLDDRGHYHHTRLEVELVDKDNQKGQ